MSAYVYRAYDGRGSAQTGTIDAETPDGVAHRLHELGLTIVSIKPSWGAGPEQVNALLKQAFARVKREQVVSMAVQLAGLVSSNVPLTRAMKSLIEQERPGYFQSILIGILDHIEGGGMFSSALRAYPKVFSPVFIHMVAAGETSGNLDEVLLQLTHYLEAEAELRQKVSTALFYPLLLIGGGLGVVVLIILTLLPTFVSIFSTSSVALPLTTRLLFGVSVFVRRYIYLILLLLLFSGIAFQSTRKIENVRRFWDDFFLKLPVIGPLVKKTMTARLAGTLSIMLRMGVPIISALESTSATLDNLVYAEALAEIENYVRKGGNLRDAFRKSGLFPPLAYQMIAVGEESGQLDTMLKKVSDHFQLETTYAIRRLTSLVEPMALVIIGGLIGILFSAVILPMFQMVRTLRPG